MTETTWTDSKQFEDAVEIVNDALLNAGIWQFMTIILRNNRELPPGVYFLTTADLVKVAKALRKVVKRDRIGYDDVSMQPQVLVQVEIKDIFPQCFAPKNLAQIAKRNERVGRQAKHFPVPLQADDQREADAFVKATLATLKDVLRID